MLKIVMCLFSMIILMGSAYPATKCERDYTGGICCWDTNTEGPFKPINC
jgi:hypothetical protein